MKKQTVSNVFIAVGAVLIAMACYLFFNDERTELQAHRSNEKVLEAIHQSEQQHETSQESAEQSEDAMLIDGNIYCAVLSIPALDLELPIQSTWSYENLDLSPCIYQQEPLSIAGHNYRVHFSNLVSLRAGDIVQLHYVSGETKKYEVANVTKIQETDIEALEDSTWALSLFTCDYINPQERILVQCNEIT